MQNRWFTYSFFLLMVSALVTLAILQYRWLGSVSEAEKQRLEEGLDASSENFVSDFNQVFKDLKNNFRIQVTSETEDITPYIAEYYLRWQDTFNHSEVVSEILIVQISEENEQVEYFTFDTGIGELVPTKPDSSVLAWVDKNRSKEENNSSRMSLSALPDFGTETLVDIPIQIMQFMSLRRGENGENLDVQLSINQLNDVMLLRIDNEYVKSTLIPEIAATYFGESYEDQYQLAILRPNDQQMVYYNSLPGELPANPDRKVDMERVNFSSVFLFENSFDSVFTEFLDGDSLSFNFIEQSKNTSRKTVRHGTQVIMNSQKNIETEEFADSILGFRSLSSTIDTTISSAIIGSISTETWELWLSFKEGSLDEFVQKTRSTNLAISFGILGILGVSGFLIVLFAQRSRHLAEQQMLFVAGVSHELRTPLTVIRSAAENLTEGVVQSEERKKEYAALMLKEGRRLSDMVDQIMEFSGIQSGKRIYTFSDVDIEQLLTELKNEFELVLEEHAMVLEYANVAKLNTIQADKGALILAISNLLNNAIKFSNGAKKIILRLDEVNYKSGLALRIQVQDFGVGIPSEEQDQVFKPFYRARRSIEHQIKGNGIGLSLVQNVAKAHQGTVQLNSIEEEGSTFTLIIPYHV